jgi:hypothetical protein
LHHDQRSASIEPLLPEPGDYMIPPHTLDPERPGPQGGRIARVVLVR